MKFKTNSKFNIKICNQYKNMIFTGFRDTDLEEKKIQVLKKQKGEIRNIYGIMIIRKHLP